MKKKKNSRPHTRVVVQLEFQFTDQFTQAWLQHLFPESDVAPAAKKNTVARKKKVVPPPKKRSTVCRTSYKKMEEDLE